ncbi:MAG TPA: trypsin-like peptidase domain-containing protein, partial [Victivallales bacterium]|nr:trypsin-like peptidase domain-containing protein [Victivallales bacterium]
MPEGHRFWFYHDKDLLVAVNDNSDRMHFCSLGFKEAVKNSSPPLNIVSAPERNVKPGTVYKYQIKTNKDNAKLKYKIELGPEGMQVSDAGLVSWKQPAHAKPSLIPIEITVSSPDSSESILHKFKICRMDIPADFEGCIIQKVISIPNKEDIQLCAVGNKGVLVRVGKNLMLLDSDGLNIKQKTTFKNDLVGVAAADGRVLALTPKSVDILDPETLQTRKSISLNGLVPEYICAHPGGDLSYVAVKSQLELDTSAKREGVDNSSRIIEIHEGNGTTLEIPGFAGSIPEMSPCGSMLFALRRTCRQIGWIYSEFGKIPHYGFLDSVLLYEMSGKDIKLSAESQPLGLNSKRLVINPEGTGVSYVSWGGTLIGNSLEERQIVFELSNPGLSKINASYNIQDPPRDIAYHPFLDLVVVAGYSKLMVFKASNGEPVAGVLEFKTPSSYASYENLALRFSPSGNNILLAISKQENSFLLSIPLLQENLAKMNLSSRNTKLVTAKPVFRDKTAKSPRIEKQFSSTNIEIISDKIKKNEMNAILKASSAKKPMDARDISSTFQHSVAVVKTKSSSGSGFFIGENGFLLTCAHIIPSTQTEINTEFKKSFKGKDVSFSVKSSILAIDRTRDIALLKADVQKAKPVHVIFEKNSKIEMGEIVYIIGNPVMADGNILSYTLTDGIVSNAERDMEGLK